MSEWTAMAAVAALTSDPVALRTKIARAVLFQSMRLAEVGRRLASVATLDESDEETNESATDIIGAAREILGLRSSLGAWAPDDLAAMSLQDMGECLVEMAAALGAAASVDVAPGLAADRPRVIALSAIHTSLMCLLIEAATTHSVFRLHLRPSDVAVGAIRVTVDALELQGAHRPETTVLAPFLAGA